ncbi:MAG: AMP-binding protein [Opitutus sp.]
MDGSPENANIARHLGLMAAAHPGRAALKIPRGRTPAGEIDYLALTFADLDTEVDAWSARLTAAGLHRGDRTLVMVRQGLPLIASVFALFRLGAIPVVIDPGMGLKAFLACVTRSRPKALVGIPLAQLLSRLFRKPFRSVTTRVSASNSLTATLRKGPHAGHHSTSGDVMSFAGDLAAILFTSGSTGAPKGVCYEHGMFDAQVALIRRTYGIEPGEIDLPLLPIFALFNPALGMTTIVPEIDPRRPADVDPARIVQAIQQEKVTNSFGSPTLWSKIGDHCRANDLTLPTLRRVLCAGAPVPAALWECSRIFLSRGRLHSPYGATEALPVTTICSDEIASLAASASVPPPAQGACVGHPVAGMDVRIIAITDSPVSSLVGTRELPPGEIGEIIVRGPIVTKVYDALPEATAAAKIDTGTDPESGISPHADHQPLAPDAAHLQPGSSGSTPAAGAWHRMGDCGFLDEQRRLWFCGRKAERVEITGGTLHTEPCEQVFRRHPRAARCALIGIGMRPQQRPALVVETSVRNSVEARALSRELRSLAAAHPHTTAIKLFYFRPKFPVDVRHNAKIHRLALARWAAGARGFESDPKR